MKKTVKIGQTDIQTLINEIKNNRKKQYKLYLQKYLIYLNTNNFDSNNNNMNYMNYYSIINNNNYNIQLIEISMLNCYGLKELYQVSTFHLFKLFFHA